MMHFNGCIIAARNVHTLFLNIKKSLSVEPHLAQVTRTFFNKENSRPSEQIPNREIDESELGLSGIDDPNFSKHLKKALLKPDFKKAYNNFSAELKKLNNEIRTHYNETWNFRLDSKDGRVDMLFTFETEEDLKKFVVYTDSSFLKGYSSASLKLTQEGTALFSGNICTDIPKDGDVKVAGYANFANALERKSFYRTKFYDWSKYSHLVLKIRGDGRTYLVIINIHGDYQETKHFSYIHPLYTRGGPYWQIAKMPFSHFYLTSKGMIQHNQNRARMLSQIRKLGITAVGFDGPFQLEVDYIGLEYDSFHKTICPYEAYR